MRESMIMAFLVLFFFGCGSDPSPDPQFSWTIETAVGVDTSAQISTWENCGGTGTCMYRRHSLFNDKSGFTGTATQNQASCYQQAGEYVSIIQVNEQDQPSECSQSSAP